MRLLICWSDISGYMAACWRALAAMPGVELRVIAYAPPAGFYSHDTVADLNCRLLNEQERNDGALIRSLAIESRPDIVFSPGWFNPHYRSLMLGSEFESAVRWGGLDTPWTGTLRQQVGRLLLRRQFSRTHRVFVAGERAWLYARKLGVDERRIVRGLYAMDYPLFATAHQQRLEQPGGWPRRFLYVGRYAPEKGLDVLTQAYARYRAAVIDPWPLACCGVGSEKKLLDGQPGIEDFGFQQPRDLPGMMARHGVLVVPSSYEPWGVVLAEAGAAGMPVICTEACGASVELVRPYHNGLLVTTGAVAALAGALRWMHEHAELLPTMGARGQQLAAAVSAQLWAMRWYEAARQSIAERSDR